MDQTNSYTQPEMQSAPLGNNAGGPNPMMPKPDNNLALAIITTVCCCLPFGIVAIIKASSVNSLYMAGNYTAAMDAAAQAKRWSLLGIGIGAVVSAIYFVLYWRTRQTLWSAVQMLTQKLCCQTIHDCPKVVPLHYESE